MRLLIILLFLSVNAQAQLKITTKDISRNNSLLGNFLFIDTTGSAPYVIKSMAADVVRVNIVTSNRIVNTVTLGLSKATLNSTYPNVPVGYMVYCPNITLGGAIYIKATENGNNDVWQTISAPPTL